MYSYQDRFAISRVIEHVHALKKKHIFLLKRKHFPSIKVQILLNSALYMKELSLFIKKNISRFSKLALSSKLWLTYSQSQVKRVWHNF